jgi:hypothetical protein
VTKWTLIPTRVRDLSRHPHATQLSCDYLEFLTMEAESEQPEGQEGTISALNAAIEAMNLAEKISTITPIKAVFGSVRTLLMIIGVCFLFFCNDLLEIYTQLGLNG